MSTRLQWIAIVMMLHPSVHAADGIADFQKICMETKKKAALCQCLSSNVERKFADLEMPIRALKGQAPGPDENSTSYDVAADFIAGLEPHCLKNSKYSGE